MIHVIHNLRKTRKHIIDVIKDLSLEKLNKIPHGFNNNIIWNVGHLVAAQQSICYIRPGLKPPIPVDAYRLYAPGTRPDRFLDSDEEDEIKKLLFTSIDALERDYQQNAFINFTPWTTRIGVELNNIDEALCYLHYHEGLHAGVIGSMKKLVQK
jgi:hypothetical protein